MGRKPISVPAGTRFGRLIVVEEAGPCLAPCGTNARRFRCKCDCGVVSVVLLYRLRSGATLSCGCLRKTNACTHGLSHSPEYNVWYGMIRRCVDPNNKDYETCGGRGITVCDRWKESCQAFLEDMGTRPSLKHIIHRVDNDGNYEPGNCRWATWKYHGRNKRNNKVLTHQGQTKCVSEWADDLGISRATLGSRLKQGWSVERALTEPALTKGLPKELKRLQGISNILASRLAYYTGRTIPYELKRAETPEPGEE